MTATAIPTSATGVDVQVRPETARGAARGHNRAGWLFATPFLVFYVLFLIGPVLIGLVISLFNTTTVTSGLGGLGGISNYAGVLGSKDFLASMGDPGPFTPLTTPPLVLRPPLPASLTS